MSIAFLCGAIFAAAAAALGVLLLRDGMPRVAVEPEEAAP